VHKCRLVLLLRRQQPDTPDVLSPAEWRWNLREVCDGKWHHYVVTVQYPQQVRYDTIEEFNMDSEAECGQLNLAHVARNKKV